MQFSSSKFFRPLQVCSGCSGDASSSCTRDDECGLRRLQPLQTQRWPQQQLSLRQPRHRSTPAATPAPSLSRRSTIWPPQWTGCTDGYSVHVPTCKEAGLEALIDRSAAAVHCGSFSCTPNSTASSSPHPHSAEISLTCHRQPAAAHQALSAPICRWPAVVMDTNATARQGELEQTRRRCTWWSASCRPIAMSRYGSSNRSPLKRLHELDVQPATNLIQHVLVLLVVDVKVARSACNVKPGKR